ncbi:MAG TPA: DUF488 domain-containing protein [Planctomycetota bacterium]
MEQNPPTSLWSLGHSTLTLAEFLELCRAHALERIVDVRRYPTSRRLPHFAREGLALALPRAGLSYVHLVDLGGHREERPGSPHTALVGAFRGYADHMETPAFAAAVTQLLRLARERRTAVMCAERSPAECHRRLLCDRLVSLGASVVHLRRDAPPEPHRLPPEARPDGGRLVYAAPRQAGLFD